MKEIWVDIIGYENEYQISNFGNVKSKDRVVENKGSFSGKISKKSMILKQSISKGYHWVKLQKNGRKKHMYIHRLVAIHFIPNKENLKEINHKDFNKSNGIQINAVINTKLDMRTKLRLLWYWLETRYAKLLRLFGVVRSTDCIPNGMYCYEYDEERNAKEPTDGYWIKTCKYYRSTPKTKGVACTYVGYMGFDPCLYDQCKICGVKDSFENFD